MIIIAVVDISELTEIGQLMRLIERVVHWLFKLMFVLLVLMRTAFMVWIFIVIMMDRLPVRLVVEVLVVVMSGVDSFEHVMFRLLN